MNQHLLDTQFATSELIKIVTFEKNEMKNLNSNYMKKKVQHDLLYRDFIRKELDPDENFTEGQMMQAFYMQSKYVSEMLQPILEEIKILERSIHIKDESIRALSGALLQIAKQGISVVYRGLSGCPDGRIIKNESLKNIIWQARNQ